MKLLSEVVVAALLAAQVTAVSIHGISQQSKLQPDNEIHHSLSKRSLGSIGSMFSSPFKSIRDKIFSGGAKEAPAGTVAEVVPQAVEGDIKNPNEVHQMKKRSLPQLEAVDRIIHAPHEKLNDIIRKNVPGGAYLVPPPRQYYYRDPLPNLLPPLLHALKPKAIIYQKVKGAIAKKPLAPPCPPAPVVNLKVDLVEPEAVPAPAPAPAPAPVEAVPVVEPVAIKVGDPPLTTIPTVVEPIPVTPVPVVVEPLPVSPIPAVASPIVVPVPEDTTPLPIVVEPLPVTAPAIAEPVPVSPAPVIVEPVPIAPAVVPPAAIPPVALPVVVEPPALTTLPPVIPVTLPEISGRADEVPTTPIPTIIPLPVAVPVLPVVVPPPVTTEPPTTPPTEPVIAAIPLKVDRIPVIPLRKASIANQAAALIVARADESQNPEMGRSDPLTTVLPQEVTTTLLPPIPPIIARADTVGIPKPPKDDDGPLDDLFTTPSEDIL